MERIEIEVWANISKLKTWLSQAEKELNRLKSEKWITLSLNLARLRQDLREVQNRLKQDLPKEASIVLSAKAERFKKEINLANRELQNFMRTWDVNKSALWQLFDSVGSKAFWMSKIIWWAVAGAFVYAWSKAVDLAWNLEQAKIAFTTMLWSEEKANTLLKQLSEFAKNTPFELTWVRENAKQLIAMWVAQENLIPTMKALWDVSAWLSVPLDRLALAYGQVLAKWRLQGWELRQFTEAWVPLLETLSKMLNKTTWEISKMIENGQIWAVEVTKAFQMMTWEGWRFENLMAKQSTTMKGLYSNLVDSLSQLWEKIGSKVIPSISNWISTLIWFINENWNAISGFISSFIDWVWDVFNFLATVWKESKIAFNFISNAIWDTIKWLWLYGDQNSETAKLVELSKWTVYDYKSAIEALSKTKYKADTAEYARERAEIIKNIQASIQLLRAKQALWVANLNEAKKNEKLTWGWSTAPTSSKTLPWASLLKIWLGWGWIKSELDKFSNNSSWLIEDSYSKQIKQMENDVKNIDKLIADASKPSQINLWLIWNTAWGKSWGGWWKSVSQKQVEARKKALEVQAELEVKAIQKSLMTEDAKANKIIEINDNLKEQLELLDWDYIDVQVKNAEKVLKKKEEENNKLKKSQEDTYDDLTKSEEKNLSDVEKLGNAYADLKKQLKEVWDKWAEDIKKINDEIEQLQNNLSKIKTEWQASLALRWIEAKNELDELNSKAEKTYADYKKISDLTAEIAFVNSNTTEWERTDALNQSLKSKAQLILDEIKANEDRIKKEIVDAETRKGIKEAEIAQDKANIQAKMDAIAIQIATEAQLLLNQDKERRRIEREYSNFFNAEISKRKDALQALIEKAKEASIALQSAWVNASIWNAVKAGNTTANNMVMNVTNNSNVDADSFLRALNNKLPSK